MSRLFNNVIDGATAGAFIGGAAEKLFAPGGNDPKMLAIKATLTVSGEALGIMIGAGAGVVKTVFEEIEERHSRCFLRMGESDMRKPHLSM